MLYYVYVLSNLWDKIYVGQTNNLDRRLLEHNEDGSASTRSKGPWKIIHSEDYATRAEAVKREKQLKSSRGRNWIKSRFLGKTSVS